MEKDLKDFMSMVSVYDSCAKRYGTPVTIDNDACAIRAFVNMARDLNNPIHHNPDDFKLVKIGYFNPITGEIFSKFDTDFDVLIDGLEASYVAEKE